MNLEFKAWAKIAIIAKAFNETPGEFIERNIKKDLDYMMGMINAGQHEELSEYFEVPEFSENQINQLNKTLLLEVLPNAVE